MTRATRPSAAAAPAVTRHHERLGDLRGQSASLHALAIIERAQGNPAEARRLLQQSLGIKERLGDLRGQAASLHELAIIESDQGNPAEARRLLQQSLGIKERLGDLGGQSASLHELAIIESDQGNPAEARRLWERSIAFKDRIGDVEGRASTLIMLAQLEVREGNRETALGMARESVRLLEGIGNAKVTMAREILAEIETFDAGGPAEAPPFLAELDELLERAKAAGPEGGLAAIDAALEEARRQAVPSREVVALLAGASRAGTPGMSPAAMRACGGPRRLWAASARRNAPRWPNWWRCARPRGPKPRRPGRRNPTGSTRRRWRKLGPATWPGARAIRGVAGGLAAGGRRARGGGQPADDRLLDAGSRAGGGGEGAAAGGAGGGARGRR